MMRRIAIRQFHPARLERGHTPEPLMGSIFIAVIEFLAWACNLHIRPSVTSSPSSSVLTPEVSSSSLTFSAEGPKASHLSSTSSFLLGKVTHMPTDPYLSPTKIRSFVGHG